MSRRKQPGTIQFCVEVGLRPDQTALSQHRSLGVLAQSIAKTFRQYDVPVTWAVANPTHSFVSTVVRPGEAQSDLALLVDRSWSLPAMSDTDQLVIVKDRIQDAHALGHSIRSLVIADCQVHMSDTMMENVGIQILRVSPETDCSTGHRETGQPDRVAQPRTRLIRVVPTATFPGYGRFLGIRDVGYGAKKSMFCALKKRSIEHIAIRSSEMLQAPDSMVRSLARVLRRVVRLRDAGRLEVCRLRDAIPDDVSPAHIESGGSTMRPAA